MRRAGADRSDVLVSPDPAPPAYPGGDLFPPPPLLKGALAALQKIVKASTRQFTGLLVVGLPVRHDDQLFNCAAVFQRGKLLGIVPKSHFPNYKEFYEDSCVTPPATAGSRTIPIDS